MHRMLYLNKNGKFHEMDIFTAKTLQYIYFNVSIHLPIFERIPGNAVASWLFEYNSRFVVPLY